MSLIIIIFVLKSFFIIFTMFVFIFLSCEKGYEDISHTPDISEEPEMKDSTIIDRDSVYSEPGIADEDSVYSEPEKNLGMGIDINKWEDSGTDFGGIAE